MELPDFLTPGPAGEIRVTGHRIDLYLLVFKYNEGWTAEMLHDEYPTLPVTLIDQVIRFYVENQKDFDDYVTSVESRIDELRAKHLPGPGMLRIRGILEERALAREKA